MSIIKVKPIDMSEESSTNWYDSRVRPFRISAAVIGMYSGTNFEPRVKRRTLLFYQVFINLLLTVSFVITIKFGFSVGETFGPQLALKAILIMIGLRGVIINWYFVWLSSNTEFLKSHDQKIEECVIALQNFGIKLSYKIDVHQWLLLGLAIFITVFNIGWMVLDLLVTKENALTNGQLEQRVTDPSLRIVVVVFALIMIFLGSNSITFGTASEMNSMHLQVCLFKAFNLKVKKIIQTSETLMVEDLRRIRLIHNKLCDMLNLSNHYWKLILATDLTSLISMVLLSLLALAGTLSGQYSASIFSTLVIVTWILMTSTLQGLLIYHADSAYYQVSHLFFQCTFIYSSRYIYIIFVHHISEHILILR